MPKANTTPTAENSDIQASRAGGTLFSNMFDFLFKRKKSAYPIFETLNADMHCHLVYGVDDGCKTITETIACLQTLQEVGYKKVYITPHFCYPKYPNDEANIKARYSNIVNELKQKSEETGLTIEMAGIAGEYKIDDGFPPKLASGCFLKIADRYLLVELSMHQHRLGIDQIMFDIQMKDHEVVLAHPERYAYYSADSKELEKLKEEGVLFQCNVLSLSGFYGENAQKKALSFIDHGWVEFLGTDLHNTVYCNALVEASRNKKVAKVLSKHQFLNNTL